jgi:hypothetical protein
MAQANARHQLTAGRGAKQWNTVLAEVGQPDGSTLLQLTYRCPTCGRTRVLNLQGLPWQAPHPDELVTDDSGRTTVDDGRRAAGQVAHVELHEVNTEVYCHWCMRGAEVTVSLPK